MIKIPETLTGGDHIERIIRKTDILCGNCLKINLHISGVSQYLCLFDLFRRFFTRPDEEIIEKYYLATDYDDRFGGDLAHVVVMQSVTRDVIDALIEDLQEQQEAETEHPAFTGYSIDLTNHLTISFGKRMNKQKSQC